MLHEHWNDEGTRRNTGRYAARLVGPLRRNRLRAVVRKQADGSDWYRLSLESRRAGQ
jgi:hypothetical protein